MLKDNILAPRILDVEDSPTLLLRKIVLDLQSSGKNIIDFGTGDPNFNTPKNIIDAACLSINSGDTHYVAASGIDILKDEIVNKLRNENSIFYSKSNIAITCGAKGAIYNLLQILCNKNDEVIIFSPYYLSYPEQIKLAEAKPIILDSFEENGFGIPISSLVKKITKKTKLIIINSPNNPTGAVYTKEELEELAEIIVKNEIFVISDEIYEKLVYDEKKHISIASLNDTVKNFVFTVNGFSKTYAMTGWRMGYVAGPKEIIALMGKFQSQSIGSLPPFIQKACIEALKGTKDSVKKMCTEYEKRRNCMLLELEKMGVPCLKPNGAFYVFPKVSQFFGKKFGEIVINNSIKLSELLLQEALVAVVFGEAYGIEGYIRMTFAPSSIEEIKEGLRRMQIFLNSLQD